MTGRSREECWEQDSVVDISPKQAASSCTGEEPCWGGGFISERKWSLGPNITVVVRSCSPLTVKNVIKGFLNVLKFISKSVTQVPFKCARYCGIN